MADLRTADVDDLTRSYGREIFARLNRSGPLLFTPSWWDERLMEWTMGDEALKVQLFRFIDVLPMLRAPEAVVRHLREYLGDGQRGLPGWVRRGAGWMPQHGWPG